MDFIKKLALNPLQVLKFSGVVLLAVVALIVFTNLFAGSSGFAPLAPDMGMSERSTIEDGGDSEVPQWYGDDAAYGGVMGAPQISVRNALTMPSPMPPVPGYTPGTDAEAFEVKDYSVTVESRDAHTDCASVFALKGRDDVIFESAHEHDRGCTLSFKVQHASAPSVLDVLKTMQPKDVSENSYTIKKMVTDYTSQSDILKKKLATVDSTLEKALAAYDEVTVLATRTQDAESLARIIDSKIGVIERLTSERTNINAQLEQLERAKAEELDRLEYTYFSVSIYENVFVDGEQLKDSWKAAVQRSVSDSSRALQALSIGLVALLLFVLQYLVYGVILLFVAKFGWTFAKKVWQSS